MFKNILVPLDGSSLSEASLSAAVALATRLGCQVTLLHVIEQDAPAEVHKERHLTNSAEAEAYLQDVVARKFPAAARVETHVHSAPVSDVARSIVEHAATEFTPDLIVTCTHGRSGVRDLLVGSIAQQIVALGTTPVLLIKPDSPPFNPQRILVPLDPDSRHDGSFGLAETIARIFDAQLDLLSVIPKYSTLTGEEAATSSLMPATAQALLDLREEQARDHLQEHVVALKKVGIAATGSVARGDPASMILRTAEQSGAGLIILSTHRKAGLGAFWARSVAPRVAQRTHTPLLLIPLQESVPA